MNIPPVWSAWRLVVLGLLSASAGSGAPITWGTPFDITSANDINVSGTLVRAVNATGDGNSLTVVAGGQSIPFQAQSLGVNATTTGTYFTADGGDTGSPALNAVLDSHVWSSSAWSFALTGLNPGTRYQVQLIAAADTRGCCSSRNQRAGDGETVERVSADFSRSGVGSVIGIFTANGPEQTVRVLPGLVNGIDPGLSGYVLRTLGAPLPPTDIVLSNSQLAPNSPPGTLIGTLSATDPDPVDTHQFSLVDTATYPDNSRFTISNGNQLRAAAALGGIGAGYEIRIRATDSNGMTRDESFGISVQSTQAPASISLSATTVLRTVPVGGSVGGFSTVDPNSGDAHTYTLVAGPGDTHNGLFSIAGDALQAAATMPAAGSVLSVRVRSTDLTALFVESAFAITVIDASVRLNEFLADNTSTSFLDEDGDSPDWIELHNPSATAFNLNGWFLTDDRANLTKWSFPAVTLNANAYRVVFASGKDRRPPAGTPLHANFSLDADGDYVALVAPDGVTVVSEFGPQGQAFPEQRPGVSYGFFGNPLQIGFMRTPTPNAANNSATAVLGFVEDTKFSVDRGFFDQPFDLEITSDTPGATIRFTTNGSWPSETAGTVYTGPIRVDRSMPVKAMASKPGFLSTNVDTQTYIFINEVVTQTSASVQSVNQFPSSWNGNAPYYGLNGNSAVVNPATHPTIKADLKAVPSMAIGIDVNDMFGSSGIYSNPTSSGDAWERRTSLELIDPAVADGSRNFQQNCAIQIQGGAFRGFGLTRKKSFRVTFKSNFGTSNLPTGGSGKLNFPLFGPDAAQEFNTLTFRMESNDGWQWSGANGQPQYARDQFGRRLSLALGQPASHGGFFHLYINGVYWGVYNVIERPDASFAESYFGADPALWQGQNFGSPINEATNLADWNTMLGVVDDITAAVGGPARDAEFLQSCGFDPDGTRNPAYPIWIDPTNLADYLLVNWTLGNADWPHRNYYCGRAREPDSTGFKFFMWDAEWTMFLGSDLTTNRTSNFQGVAAPQDHVEESPEYRIRFADRAFRALFNDGPLTPARSRAIYEDVTTLHPSFLIPESARWGNQHGQQRGVAHWQTEYNRIINNWFPARTNNVIGQLRARQLYPAIDAPRFSQNGGSVPAGGSITMSATATVPKIYFQFGPGDADPTDFEHSLDPRLVGGGIHPSATVIEMGGGGGVPTTQFVRTGDTWKFLDDGSDQGTAWRGVGFDDAGWESGPSQLGYGDMDEAQEVGFIDIDPVTAGVQRNATTYFRRVVEIPTPGVFGDFTLGYTFDDAIAVYVNGQEAARENIAANPPYDQYGSGSSDNQTGFTTLQTTRFQPGLNTIAVEIHQNGSGSTDISFDLTLIGNPPGGTGTNTSPPIPIPGPGWMLARSYDPVNGVWSALNSAFFTVNTVPADGSNLVVSEFHYHPSEPPAGAVSTDRDDYEFIELMNVSPSTTIDLTGVRFIQGIEFEFADGTTIPPAGRCVIVRNRAAFESRYPGRLGSIVFALNTGGTSEFTGRLSNEGEQLILVAADGGEIRNFTWDDILPWPTAADGLGHPLILKNPAIPPPDHSMAQNWVAGSEIDGGPGGPDPFGFTGDPDADLDGDGLAAVLEFALGTSDSDPLDGPIAVGGGYAEFNAGGSTGRFLHISFTRNHLADNLVEWIPEVSTDLGSWAGGSAVVLVSETDHGDGTSTMVWRSATPTASERREFIRLRVITLP